MDPNPNSFPVLSYVMSRLNLNSNPQPQDPVDVEQAQLQMHRNPQQELVEVMPHLDHPDLLASMAPAVSDVAQARSVLRALGDRPDHESVDQARAAIASLDERLSRMEGNTRAAAEGERARHAAVLQLDEMHEAYGTMLREAEERLVRIYERHGKEEEGSDKGKEAAEEANDEVIGILREEATGKGMERVELSGRQLKFLPEAFGRMKGLVSLDLSSNLLEVFQMQ
ncbi:plant intracellular Ras-group-related LRR protein 3-like [Iris pallida]|uniref:Plant intracellular Ras-group-related LRR protein 3-like n=1 Tax=Iris pallida TaxID=29817 RepID=A0AAX6HPI1_IRIPA|nr:plant intracellular Ras-group-related LRR protein 3-like [Iris pallida]